jgi:hypothetical protein
MIALKILLFAVLVVILAGLGIVLMSGNTRD